LSNSSIGNPLDWYFGRESFAKIIFEIRIKAPKEQDFGPNIQFGLTPFHRTDVQFLPLPGLSDVFNQIIGTLYKSQRLSKVFS
jgi:hypothetical protein